MRRSIDSSASFRAVIPARGPTRRLRALHRRILQWSHVQPADFRHLCGREQPNQAPISSPSEGSSYHMTKWTISVDLSTGRGGRSSLPAASNGDEFRGQSWDAYKRVADAFFDRSSGMVHFHSLVVDTNRQDHLRWNKGSREIGFQKEVYQLAQSSFVYIRSLSFICTPINAQPRRPPQELRDILNHGARKKGDRRDWPFRRVHFRALSGCLPLQVVDILLGALRLQAQWTLRRAGRKHGAQRTVRPHPAPSKHQRRDEGYE